MNCEQVLFTLSSIINLISKKNFCLVGTLFFFWGKVRRILNGIVGDVVMNL